MNSLTLWGFFFFSYYVLKVNASHFGARMFPVFRLYFKDVGLLVVVKIAKFRLVGVSADEVLFSNVSLLRVITINDIYIC